LRIDSSFCVESQILPGYLRQFISFASYDPDCEKLNLLMVVMLADPKGDLPAAAVFVFVIDVRSRTVSSWWRWLAQKTIPLMTLISLIYTDQKTVK
jgi:hypothetical protein